MLTRNLLLRVLSGVPMAAAAIGFFYFTPKNVFITISILLAEISTWEFCQGTAKRKIPLKPLVVYLSVLLSFFSFLFYWSRQDQWGLIMALATLILVLFFSLLNYGYDKKLFFWYVLPLLWIVFPFIVLIVLRFSTFGSSGSSLIIFVILVAAFNDIFAYLGGKKFGKRQLAPTISPNKTIEGSLFGFVGGLAAGVWFQSFFLADFISGWKLFLLIIIVTLASQIGDLLESKFKRYCKIKDSSKVLPGHGGLLDRIDSYLVALPVFFGMIYALGIKAS